MFDQSRKDISSSAGSQKDCSRAHCRPEPLYHTQVGFNSGGSYASPSACRSTSVPHLLARRGIEITKRKPSYGQSETGCPAVPSSSWGGAGNSEPKSRPQGLASGSAGCVFPPGSGVGPPKSPEFLRMWARRGRSGPTLGRLRTPISAMLDHLFVSSWPDSGRLRPHLGATFGWLRSKMAETGPLHTGVDLDRNFPEHCRMWLGGGQIVASFHRASATRGRPRRLQSRLGGSDNSSTTLAGRTVFEREVILRAGGTDFPVRSKSCRWFGADFPRGPGSRTRLECGRTEAGFGQPRPELVPITARALRRTRPGINQPRPNFGLHRSTSTASTPVNIGQIRPIFRRSWPGLAVPGRNRPQLWPTSANEGRKLRHFFRNVVELGPDLVASAATLANISQHLVETGQIWPNQADTWSNSAWTSSKSVPTLSNPT